MEVEVVMGTVLQLRALLALVEADDVECGPLALAHLRGSLAALEQVPD